MFDNETNGKYSHDFKDVINTFPVKFNYLLTIGLFCIMLFLIVLSFCVESPDVIKGKATIYSTSPIADLSFGENGKIKYLIDPENKKVKKNQYLAVIKNHGSHEEIQDLKNVINQIDLEDFSSIDSIELIINSNKLGDLQSYTSDFISDFKKYKLAIEGLKYKKEKDIINTKIALYKKILNERKKIKELNNKKFKYSEELINVDDILYDKDVISKTDLLSKKKVFLEEKEKVFSENVITNSYLLTISELKHNLIKLDIDNNNNIQELKLKCISKLKKLFILINNWEDNFVIKSSYDGILERLSFVPEDSYVRSGIPLLAVIPNDNKINCNAIIPINGAGKIKKGQDVRLKIDSYPYEEFGYLEGSVNSISLIPSDGNYFIDINLFKGMVTNTNTKLELINDLEGRIEILTKKRKLIDRLFEKLKHSLDQK